MELISFSEVEQYRREGYKVLDLHLHTSASNDVFGSPRTDPYNIYRGMIKAGFDFIIFTDHDTLDAYDMLPDDPRIVTGVEIAITPELFDGYTNPHTLHVNVYRLNKNQFNQLEILAERADLDQFIGYLRNQNLAFALNHPTWQESDDEPDWAFIDHVLERFDVIEVYNQTRTYENNKLSLELAVKYNKGMTAGSDNHAGRPGYALMAKGDTFEEVWENIKKADVLIVDTSLKYRDFVKDMMSRLDDFCICDDVESNTVLTSGPLLNLHKKFSGHRVYRTILKGSGIALSPTIYSAYSYLQKRNARQIRKLMNIH